MIPDQEKINQRNSAVSIQLVVMGCIFGKLISDISDYIIPDCSGVMQYFVGFFTYLFVMAITFLSLYNCIFIKSPEWSKSFFKKLFYALIGPASLSIILWSYYDELFKNCKSNSLPYNIIVKTMASYISCIIVTIVIERIFKIESDVKQGEEMD